MPTALPQLLRHLQPRLNPGVYAYVSITGAIDLSKMQPLATFREDEALTLVIDAPLAERAGWAVLMHVRWITLDVSSELDAVGLTAAVAGALTGAGVPCNVIAAARHDHLFVPVAQAQLAMKVLRELQHRAQR